MNQAHHAFEMKIPHTANDDWQLCAFMAYLNKKRFGSNRLIAAINCHQFTVPAVNCLYNAENAPHVLHLNLLSAENSRKFTLFEFCVDSCAVSPKS